MKAPGLKGIGLANAMSRKHEKIGVSSVSQCLSVCPTVLEVARGAWVRVRYSVHDASSP